MTVTVSLIVLALSVGALMAAIAVVRQCGQRYGWAAEVQRKAVHVAIGLYALALPVLFDREWPVVALIIIALALMLLLRLPASRTTGLGATIHSVERRSAGDIWLALAIGFVFLRSDGIYILYGLPIAVIALSDAAAALTGSAYGRTRFTVEEGVKSWEGIVAFFAVTLIVAMVMLLLLTDVARPNVVMLAFAIAGFSALVEAVSWRGLDNLFVPVCIHFFLSGYLHAAPFAVAVLAGAFVSFVVIGALLAPRLSLSAHASRAMLIALFFFLGVGGLYGAVLPLMLIAAHLVARARHPCHSPHGDLDFVATLCGVGLIWLFVGETVGPQALNLYNLSLAGMALGYAIIALAYHRGLAMVMSAAVTGFYLVLITIGPAAPRWVQGLPGLAVLSLLLVATVLAIGRHRFDRWRAPRLAAVASIVPMAAYLYQTVMP